MTDQSLSDHDDAAPDGPGSGILATAAASEAVQNFLTLDAVLNSSRLVERTAHICLRGDLEDQYNAKIEELTTLVGADGELLAEGDDAALADGARAEKLEQEALELHKRMRAETYAVRFRAMPDDEWDKFEALHRKNGKVVNLRKYHNELIAKCAINPELTVAEVTQLRSKLNANQMVTLSNEAYWANTTGGLDIPKSPGFSHSPKPQE